MHARLIIASTCPTCGAPLDFAEGVHAIQCGYCRSNLLITGHKQVLSYAITPTMTAVEAKAHIERAHRELDMDCRVRQVTCYFLPYYRFTGHDVRWTQAKSRPNLSTLPLALRDAVLTHQAMHGGTTGSSRLTIGERYVEKNFLACPFPPAGLYSLGIRPAVLRLEPFRPERCAQLGTVVPVTMSVKDALTQGMRTPTETALVTRLVLGKMLSLIYFPYWMVEVERGNASYLSIVDAVGHTIVTRAAPVSLMASFPCEPISTARVISFRPLVCPNCGWDLPLTLDATVFCCTGCDQAWHILGSELHPIAYEIASLPGIKTVDIARYLPFWVLHQKSTTGSVRPFVLPAFRYRRLKLLIDLATRFTEKQPEYVPCHDVSMTTLHPCFYDQGDAALLAHFLYRTLAAKQRGRRQPTCPTRLSFAHATLTWFPFMRQGRYLVDPLTGLHLYENILS